MAIEFREPDKRCPKCDSIIQANGYERDVFGNDIVDVDGHAIHHRGSALICEKCARLAMPPKPPRKRRKKGEVDENQQALCDKPDLKYVGQDYGSGKDE